MNRCDPLLVARIGYAVLADLPAKPVGGHVVLVTSAHPGCAHLVADLLGQEMATRINGNVALVDAAPPAAAAPESDGAAGLSGLLADPKADLGKLAQANAAGVFRMARGADLRPDSFFQVDTVAGALNALRERFKFTVIHGPALDECGALIDQADKVLLAIDAQATSPRVVRRAMARAGVAQGGIDGVVLTNAQTDMPSWLASE